MRVARFRCLQREGIHGAQSHERAMELMEKNERLWWALVVQKRRTVSNVDSHTHFGPFRVLWGCLFVARCSSFSASTCQFAKAVQREPAYLRWWIDGGALQGNLARTSLYDELISSQLRNTYMTGCQPTSSVAELTPKSESAVTANISGTQQRHTSARTACSTTDRTIYRCLAVGWVFASSSQERMSVWQSWDRAALCHHFSCQQSKCSISFPADVVSTLVMNTLISYRKKPLQHYNFMRRYFTELQNVTELRTSQIRLNTCDLRDILRFQCRQRRALAIIKHKLHAIG